MKLIHTSDWHIGNRLYNYERSEEHLHFFEQLGALITREKPDILLVCGDIYDTATPSNESMKLYTQQMVALHKCCPTMKIVVIAGNHDSPTRLESTSDIWELANLSVIGNTEEGNLERYILEIPEYGYVIAVPFIHSNKYVIFNELQEMVKQRNTQNLPVVMTGHLTVVGSDFSGHKQQKDRLNHIGGIEGVSLSALGDYYDYLALGHIHRPQTLKTGEGIEKARYAGSPVCISFDEKHYPHTVSVVELTKHGEIPIIKDVEIHSLISFVDLPEEPLPPEEVLKVLQEYVMKYDSDEQKYLRINVLVENYLPHSFTQNVIDILDNKKERLHFCYINQHINRNIENVDIQEYTCQDIAEMAPMDLAKNYYRETKGIDLDETLQKMLQQVIDEVCNQY